MEYLTKQQIVLLTLLVSFVTAIATGTVVVSLTDQSPEGITSTINHIIERTVEGDSVADTSTNTSDQASVINAISSMSNVDSSIPNAIAGVQKSVVTIRRINSNDSSDASSSGEVTGLGTIISKDGIIVTDRSAVDAAMLSTYGEYIAVLPTGETFTMQTVQPKDAPEQDTGDLVFLALNIPNDQRNSIVLKSATLSIHPPKLGQSVITLTTGDSPSVDTGIVNNLADGSSSSMAAINTSIVTSSLLPGSVLFDSTGNILGIKTSSVTFYPASRIQAMIR